ncbi:MAG TPA: thioredoxin domain-containing protein [Longimicrobiales bacterium]|nr:thioredoxin domain-containing protein [Longimicrobiales bacterium]
MAPRNKPAASKGSDLRIFYIILALVAVVGLGTLGARVLGSRAGGAVLEPIELEGIENPRALFEMARPMSKGSPEAPVKLVVFSDYQCPYCAQFASMVNLRLKAEYLDAGKVYLEYYDFPLGGGHKHSFVAARAARCAGDQGRFWEYHDLLFGQQSRWSLEERTPLAQFEEYAGQLGLNTEEFRSCVRSDRHADVVTANRLLGEQLGVTGTPYLLINNKRVTNWGFNDLKRLIDAELGE